MLLIALACYVSLVVSQNPAARFCDSDSDCDADTKCIPLGRPQCTVGTQKCQVPDPCDDPSSDLYCNCVDECPGAVDEGICACTGGYSDEFIVFPGMLMDGYNLAIYFDLTLAECQAFCLNTTGCVNVEVRQHDGKCYLGNESPYTRPLDFIYTGTYDLYQRRCICP